MTPQKVGAAKANKNVIRPFRVNFSEAEPKRAHPTLLTSLMYDPGNGTVTEPRMYQLRQTAPIADRQFEIEFLDPGVDAYCFTFG